MSNVQKFDYNGLLVAKFIKQDQEWFNATEVAHHCGKRPHDFMRLKTTKEYIDALEKRNDESRFGDYHRVSKGGFDIQGTWIHRSLFMRFAQWVSADFAIWCDESLLYAVTMQIESLPDFTNPAESARAYADQYEQKEKAKLELSYARREIEELTPLALALKLLEEGTDEMTLTDAAQALNSGVKRLCSYCRLHSIFREPGTQPYQRFIEQGYFTRKLVADKNDNSKRRMQTFVRAKGLVWLAKRLAPESYATVRSLDEMGGAA